MEAPDLAARVVEHIPIGIVVAAPDATIWLNAFMRELLGAAPTTREALAQLAPSLVERLDADGPDFPDGLELGSRRMFVQPLVMHGGGRALLLVPLSLLQALDPEVQQLEQSYRDFHEIFRNSFDGIFVADGKGNTLMVNPGCERNYDLDARDMIGKNVSVFERKGYIRPVIAGRVISERDRVTAVQQTHTGKTIMVTGIPLFDDSGSVRRVIINSRDTTELLQLQDELARAQDNLRRMESEIHELRRENLKVEGVVLSSPQMQRIAALALRIAKVDSTILITGESGVGKEVVAKLIHRESNRSDGPFIKINCGAIPRELLESELFGYESGAFTGARRQGKLGLIETASGGTLFLDEIGELPLDLQVKLLEVLQDHRFSRLGGTEAVDVDLRIVAATNVDLEDMVEQRRFRSDLYYRLNVVPIHIPPLRERHDDILPLIHQCLDDFNVRYGLARRISERALQRMLDYHWPGNVRELRNIVERVVVTAHSDHIVTDDLPRHFQGEAQSALTNPAMFGLSGRDLKTRVACFEAELVREAVQQFGTTRAAASVLGVSQATVVRKMRGTLDGLLPVSLNACKVPGP